MKRKSAKLVILSTALMLLASISFSLVARATEQPGFLQTSVGGGQHCSCPANNNTCQCIYS